MNTNTKRPIATNRFEEIGVRMQENARTWHQAVDSYNYSCTLCSMHDHDGRKDCSACPIRAALLANVEWHGIPADDVWVQKEIAMA